jgi:hypothetical protein
VQTAVVFIEFNVYNGNVDQLLSWRIMHEMPAGGGVVSHASWSFLPSRYYKTLSVTNAATGGH